MATMMTIAAPEGELFVMKMMMMITMITMMMPMMVNVFARRMTMVIDNNLL